MGRGGDPPAVDDRSATKEAVPRSGCQHCLEQTKHRYFSFSKLDICQDKHFTIHGQSLTPASTPPITQLSTLDPGESFTPHSHAGPETVH